jgi:hypothetical protein
MNAKKTLISPLLGILLAAALTTASEAATSTEMSQASKAVWDGHLQKAMSGNLDAVMADFTDDSAILTAGKTYSGKAAVREFVGNAIKSFTPEAVKTIVMQSEVPLGNVVYTKLTVGAAKRTFVYTAVIDGGKIMTITETDFPAE